MTEEGIKAIVNPHGKWAWVTLDNETFTYPRKEEEGEGDETQELLGGGVEKDH